VFSSFIPECGFAPNDTIGNVTRVRTIVQNAAQDSASRPCCNGDSQFRSICARNAKRRLQKVDMIGWTPHWTRLLPQCGNAHLKKQSNPYKSPHNEKRPDPASGLKCFVIKYAREDSNL
jgi:hypothetical protein